MARNIPYRIARPRRGAKPIGWAQTLYVLSVGFVLFLVMGFCLGFTQAPRAVSAALGALLLLLLWLVLL